MYQGLINVPPWASKRGAANPHACTLPSHGQIQSVAGARVPLVLAEKRNRWEP